MRELIIIFAGIKLQTDHSYVWVIHEVHNNYLAIYVGSMAISFLKQAIYLTVCSYSIEILLAGLEIAFYKIYSLYFVKLDG